jgi:hypothetical protein
MRLDTKTAKGLGTHRSDVYTLAKGCATRLEENVVEEGLLFAGVHAALGWNFRNVEATALLLIRV